jgi:hypothetical protein
VSEPVRRRPSSAGSGGWRFPADPQKPFDKQAIFWTPEVLPTVLPVRATNSPMPKRYKLDIASLPRRELRRAPDGWHAIVPLGGAKHRLWLRELPPSAPAVVVDLPVDRDFAIRLQAAHRFWLALERRPLGTPALARSVLRQRRFILSLRALDGSLEGNSYREIAQGLFGMHRIPRLGWKTHDLRSQTIRLVKTGRRLMRLGCRALFHKSRDRDENP